MTQLDKQLKSLITKQFKVYIDDELQIETGFLGFLNLLHSDSHFFEYSFVEQREAIRQWIENEKVYLTLKRDNMYVEIYP